MLERHIGTMPVFRLSFESVEGWGHYWQVVSFFILSLYGSDCTSCFLALLDYQYRCVLMIVSYVIDHGVVILQFS